MDTKNTNDGPASFKYGSSKLQNTFKWGYKGYTKLARKGGKSLHTRIYVCLEGELKFWENIYALKDVSSQLYGMKIKSYVIPANS